MAERKRVHRVLVPSLAEGEVVLRGPEAHHLREVLRVKPGAAVEAFDGVGAVAQGEVSSVDSLAVTLSLAKVRASNVEHPRYLTVAVALLKSDKLTGVVRQGTELGVQSFQLLTSRRCDVRSLAPSRFERLRRVAEEAARQSGRARVPELHEPRPLAELTWRGAAVVADPDATLSVAEAIASPELATAKELTVVTGPEGGFSGEELTELTERGALAVTLGPRILRAETAPVALAAALLLCGGWS